MGGRVYEPGEGMGKLVYEQREEGGRILSQQGGFQVSRKGSKGEQRGAKGEQRKMPCT